MGWKSLRRKVFLSCTYITAGLTILWTIAFCAGLAAPPPLSQFIMTAGMLLLAYFWEDVFRDES